MYRQIMQILDTWDTFSHLSHTFFFFFGGEVSMYYSKKWRRYTMRLKTHIAGPHSPTFPKPSFSNWKAPKNSHITRVLGTPI